MKKILFITLICSMMAPLAKSQHLFGETYYERTPSSPKLGVAIGYANENFQWGGFYQAYNPTSIGDDPQPYVEEEFFGIFGGAVVGDWDRTSLLLRARVGVANREQFVISPSFHVDYEPIRRFHLQAGVALRTITPSAIVGVRLDLNGVR